MMTVTSEAPRSATRSTADFRDGTFLRLFSGSAVSLVGSRVTMVALPLIAIRELSASVKEIGILTAVGTAAFLLIGLPAGALIDRVRKQRVLVVTDLGRAAVSLASWLRRFEVEEVDWTVLARTALPAVRIDQLQAGCPGVQERPPRRR